MIQAVSSLNAMNAKTNFRNASSVAFKGNLATLVKDEVALSGKASKVLDATAGTIARKARSVVNRNELPITKKPVTAAIDLGEIIVPGGLVAAEKNPARAKVIVQAAIVDNVAFGATKYALATKAAAAGAVVGGPIGAAVGFLGVYVAWGSLRNHIAKNS